MRLNCPAGKFSAVCRKRTAAPMRIRRQVEDPAALSAALHNRFRPPLLFATSQQPAPDLPPYPEEGLTSGWYIPMISPALRFLLPGLLPHLPASGFPVPPGTIPFPSVPGSHNTESPWAAVLIPGSVSRSYPACTTSIRTGQCLKKIRKKMPPQIRRKARRRKQARIRRENKC